MDTTTGLNLFVFIISWLILSASGQTCSGNPCDRGTCSDLAGGGYQCDCNFGYNGTNCDTHTSDCDVDSKITCTGNPSDQDLCEQLGCCYTGADQCYHSDAAPFGLDGHCDSIASGDREECGYNGIQWDECVNTRRCCWYTKDDGVPWCFKPDRCEASPCLNEATCVNDESNYTCACPAPYTGTDCETDMDATTQNTSPEDTTPESTSPDTTPTADTTTPDSTTPETTQEDGPPTDNITPTLPDDTTSVTQSAGESSLLQDDPDSGGGLDTKDTLVITGAALAALMAIVSCAFVIGGRLMEKKSNMTEKPGNGRVTPGGVSVNNQTPQNMSRPNSRTTSITVQPITATE